MGFLDGLRKGISDSSNKQKFANIAIEYYKAKRWESALENFDKALEIDANDADQLINKGACLRHLNRSNEALTAYAKAIQINPSSATAYSNQAMAFLDLKNYTEALTSFKTANKLGEDSGVIQMHVSICLAKTGHISEAIQLIDGLIKEYPTLGSLLYVKGKMMLINGNVNDAHRCFEDADNRTKEWGNFKDQIDSLF